MLKGNNHLDNYAQITKKQNEKVSDYMTNSWQKKGSSIHPSTQVNKDVKIRINNLKDVKNMTLLLIGKQYGSCIKSSRETRPAAYFVFVVFIWQNSAWQNWNSWWWHSPKSDDEQSMIFFFDKNFLSVHAG